MTRKQASVCPVLKQFVKRKWGRSVVFVKRLEILFLSAQHVDVSHIATRIVRNLTGKNTRRIVVPTS